MPSHTDTEPAKLEKAPHWLKPWHVLGNNIADKLADLAANLHALSREQTKAILETLNMQTLIQKRLVAVIKNMPPRQLRAEAMQIPKKVSKNIVISRFISFVNHHILPQYARTELFVIMQSIDASGCSPSP